MALESNLKQQLVQYLELLEDDIVIAVITDSSAVSDRMVAFAEEVAGLSSQLSVEFEQADYMDLPEIRFVRNGTDVGVGFAGVPLGHEFASFVLALLQASGRPPKVDQSIIDRVKDIRKHYNFTTFISLSCHNCPDVVQALNMMAILNPNITHTMVDGGSFKGLMEDKDILAVPYVENDDGFFLSGKADIEKILAELGSETDLSEYETKEYDVTVIGGGPAGVAAAIYAARKGIKTAIIAERFGGQVMDTMAIENLIGTKSTTGPKLGTDLEKHLNDYDVDIIKQQRISKRTSDVNGNHILEFESGSSLKTQTAIIATGARWRQLGVPGEEEFKNKGVAYCPHCDGPLFKGKDVAVIGGGNSGVEAAIDLAGIVKHVTVFEFMPELKADKILQDKLNSLDNVSVITNAATKQISGAERVSGIVYTSRDSSTDYMVPIDGVFIQIGLVSNTEWVDCEKTPYGEIVTSPKGETSIPGVFAAGDCTDVPYKQIIISMGAGASAALGAFDYLIRK